MNVLSHETGFIIRHTNAILFTTRVVTCHARGMLHPELNQKPTVDFFEIPHAVSQTGQCHAISGSEGYLY